MFCDFFVVQFDSVYTASYFIKIKKFTIIVQPVFNARYDLPLHSLLRFFKAAYLVIKHQQEVALHHIAAGVLYVGIGNGMLYVVVLIQQVEGR